MEDAYVRKATVLYWEDGDSVKLRVDLGVRTHNESLYRLYGIEAKKISLPEGKEALRVARSLAPELTFVYVRIHKSPEKYGRWMVDIYVTGLDVSINDYLVEEGLAVPYFGGKKPL